MFLCVPNSVFSCASCAVIPALCLSPLRYLFCTLYVCIRACSLSRYDVCVLYLSSYAIIPVRCVWLVPVCPCVLCVPVSCAVILCSVCLLCGIHSVRSMYPCVLSTLVQCVRALSLFVCYYSLCCVKLIPVCSCVAFRAFLRISCDVFSTFCLSPLWYSFLSALCICVFCILLHDVCIVHFCVLCLVHSRVFRVLISVLYVCLC